MSNGDAGIPTDVGQISTERDFGKELAQASEVGRIVLGVTKERTENPQFHIRKYTMPMLDLGGFPQEAVRTILSKKGQVTEGDVKAVREASVALAIESAVQVVAARPTSSQVSEDPDSLEQMARMVNRGAGLVIQTESSDLQLVIKAGKAAIERHKGAKGLEDADNWDDQKVLVWTKEMFKRAGGRLKKGIDAIAAYHRR